MSIRSALVEAQRSSLASADCTALTNVKDIGLKGPGRGVLAHDGRRKHAPVNAH